MHSKTSTGASVRRITTTATIAISVALLLGAGSSQAASSPTHQTAGAAHLIVRTVGDDSSGQRKAISALGGDVYRNLPIIHSLAIELPASKVCQLKSLSFVAHVSPDAQVRKTDEFTDASSLAGTAYAADGANGYKVNVAVVDTGVTLEDDLRDEVALPSHPTLAPSRIVTSISFVPATATVPYSTADQCGHGTHVAGMIAGCGTDSMGPNAIQTYYGVACRASIVNVRVLNNEGEGSVSQVIAGIQWVVTNKKLYNISVMNLSLGEPVGESYTVDPLCQAVEAAWKAGVVVVVAAGNNGRLNPSVVSGAANEGYGTAYGSITSPGNDPYVITVGATKNYNGTRADDRIATYSGRGPTRLDMVLKPDIIAPGNEVISVANPTGTLAGVNIIPWTTYSKTTPTYGVNKYFMLSGTSMATAVISGAAAMLLQASPTISPDTVKARLMMSADKWADPTGVADPCTYGAGYVDIPSALASTVVATQFAMSPTLSQDNAGNVAINVNSNIWGSRAVWGTGVNDFRAVWGTDALTGTSENVLTDSRAVWGTSVWSNSTVWATSTTAVDLSSVVLNGEGQ